MQLLKTARCYKHDFIFPNLFLGPVQCAGYDFSKSFMVRDHDIGQNFVHTDLLNSEVLIQFPLSSVVIYKDKVGGCERAFE